ncbi:hypothetical protein V2W45_1464297 [Cenococcum geophilum]
MSVVGNWTSDNSLYFDKSCSSLTWPPDLTSNDLRCNSDAAVYHQGPVSFYTTKVADTTIANGSTPWFKIKDIGPTFPESYSVIVPSCLAAGDYLLRIEQSAIHNPWPAGIPYPSGVSILGAFKDTYPGYTIYIYNSFNIYTVPGPVVWTC